MPGYCSPASCLFSRGAQCTGQPALRDAEAIILIIPGAATRRGWQRSRALQRTVHRIAHTLLAHARARLLRPWDERRVSQHPECCTRPIGLRRGSGLRCVSATGESVGMPISRDDPQAAEIQAAIETCRGLLVAMLRTGTMGRGRTAGACRPSRRNVPARADLRVDALALRRCGADWTPDAPRLDP